MITPTDVQLINDAEGDPAFVIPYAQYMAQKIEAGLIPHEVHDRIANGSTPVLAWREYLNLTQKEVARRIGIPQQTFAQQEKVAKPGKAMLERIASAFGINVNQLDL